MGLTNIHLQSDICQAKNHGLLIREKGCFEWRIWRKVLGNE